MKIDTSVRKDSSTQGFAQNRISKSGILNHQKYVLANFITCYTLNNLTTKLHSQPRLALLYAGCLFLKSMSYENVK